MQRLTQPSTWAGIGLLIQMCKTIWPQYAPIIDGISTAAGGLAVVLNEKAKAQ